MMNRTYTDLDIEKVTIKRPPRRDNGNMDSLTASVRTVGLLFPILVDGNNVLIAGGRRLEACRRAGLTTIPVVRLDVSYKSPEALAVRADENLCRLPLSVEDLDELIRLKTSAAGAGKGGFMSRLKRLFRHD